jgi:hypothetical protein
VTLSGLSAFLADTALERVEILAHLAAGAGCLAFGATLLARHDRTRLHARVGQLVVVLGFAIACRALHWATGNAALVPAMQLGFALFPLPLALTFETLLARPLHLPAKIVLLAGTIGFGVAGLTAAPGASGGLGDALVAYHTLVVGYLGALALVRRGELEPGPQRSLVGAALIVCALSLPLMATDWLTSAAFRVPRLGAVPALLLLFFGGAAVHTAGESRLRASLYRLGATLGFTTLLAGAIVLALGRAAIADALVVATVLVAAALAFEPLRHYLSVSRLQRTDVLLRRLGELPAGDLDALVDGLRRWPELEGLCRVHPDPDLIDDPARLAAKLAGLGAMVARGELKERLARAPAPAPVEQRLLEELAFLMDSHEVDHLALLDARGEFLGVRFAMGAEPELYRPALAIIAALARGGQEVTHA